MDINAIPFNGEVGTNVCINCEIEFTEENPCCCDDRTHFDSNNNITHVDGVCVECCVPNHKGRNIYDGMSAAGGTFERGE